MLSSSYYYHWLLYKWKYYNIYIGIYSSNWIKCVTLTGEQKLLRTKLLCTNQHKQGRLSGFSSMWTKGCPVILYVYPPPASSVVRDLVSNIDSCSTLPFNPRRCLLQRRRLTVITLADIVAVSATVRIRRQLIWKAIWPEAASWTQPSRLRSDAMSTEWSPGIMCAQSARRATRTSVRWIRICASRAVASRSSNARIAIWRANTRQTFTRTSDASTRARISFW